MRGYGLMQAIARVNRVFKDKPGGLVVDYLGLAHELKQALAIYTESGGKGQTAIDQAEAVALMQEKFEICTAFFHGFDRSTWTAGGATAKLALLPTVRENVRANLRVIIKRILRKHGYPPDKQERATATVLEQLEALSRAWTAGGELTPE